MTKKIKIAVVGLGRVGITHLEAIKELPDQIDLIALVDSNTEILKKVASIYKPKKSYSSFEAVLKDSEVEAVLLALPHNLHCPISLQIIESGKHVLVEKPMAISVAEADRMIEAADKAGVNLMVGHTRRYDPAYQLSKTYLPKIGKAFSIVLLMMAPITYNAPAWWKSEAATGGLVFTLAGPHVIDYCLWLFDDRKPISVYATSYSNNPSYEGPDEGTIIIEMDDGSSVNLHLSFNTSPSVQQCFITGSQGTMSFSHFYKKGDLIGRSKVDLVVNGELVFKDDGSEWSFRTQMREFANSIIEKRRPSTSGEIGRQVVRVIEAALESAKTKNVVKF